ncbi:MAG: hypothetical protein Q9164_004684 [Protoblastenia rupestris]
MSAPRLIFLYPHLFKPVYGRDVNLSINSAYSKSRHAQKAALSTTRKQRLDTYAQRYGTAQEPQPPPPESQMPPKPPEEKTLAGTIEKEVKGPPIPEEKKAEAPPPKEAEKKPQETSKKSALEDRGIAIEAALKDPASRARDLDTSSPKPYQTSADTTAGLKESKPAKPLATVLEMPAPTVEKPEEHKAPHLQAPPYLHHFDTYTLVKDLQRGGFTDDQSVTLMKAVRSLLAVNMDIAKEGLISKSDVENETYLFRAACSELRTEVLNLRRSTTSKQHTQLSHLQHTHDILSQRTTAELASLRDELKGMLNDRRMDTRASSQVLDSEISELNYKISVALNSDSKSEVEGLRWVLTRRAAMAIAVMAVLILGSLRWGSYKIHEREIKARKMAGRGKVADGGAGAGVVGYTQASREMGTQTEGNGGGGGVGERDKAESVGYVSLG